MTTPVAGTDRPPDTDTDTDPHIALARAEAMLRTVLAVDGSSVSGAEAMTWAVGAERVQRVLEAVRLQGLSILEATGECERLGHKTVSAWSAHNAHLPRGLTALQGRLARAIRAMPLTAAALAASEISVQHVDVLVRANSRSRAAAFAEHEALLVGFARDLSFKDFVTAVGYWRNAADPDDAETEAADKCSRRRLHSSRTLDGMGRIDAWLDPIGFTEFDNELHRLAQVEFARDWSLARELHGEATTIDTLGRSSEQRRADALLEMARRSASAAPGSRRPEPLVVILADQATAEAAAAHYANPETSHSWPLVGTCRLEDGTTITPAEMFEQLLMGRFRKLLQDATGAVLDYGRSQRLYRGDLREALRFRDGVCDFDGCDIPARHGQADHINSWEDGGPTNERNGHMPCGYHHRRRRRLEGQLHVQRDPETGHVNWTAALLDDDDEA
jgi:hypothetical protein